MVQHFRPCGSASCCLLEAIAPIALSLLLAAAVADAGPVAAAGDTSSPAPLRRQQLATTPSANPPAADGSGRQIGQRSADARFIVMMIPHHEGAIAMAELAMQRSQRAEIRALAERIRSSQSRENSQMRRWYRQWYGTDVPTWPGPGWGGGMGMAMGGRMGGGMAMGCSMPGFATSLEALRTAPDFDRAFLEQMIAHHRMGVMMASHAQWNTIHPELRQLEAAMVQVQSEEIEQMARWVQQWYRTALQ